MIIRLVGRGNFEISKAYNIRLNFPTRDGSVCFGENSFPILHRAHKRRKYKNKVFQAISARTYLIHRPIYIIFEKRRREIVRLTIAVCFSLKTTIVYTYTLRI